MRIVVTEVYLLRDKLAASALVSIPVLNHEDSGR